MTTLRHIRAFVATAEHGGTAGAARAQNISQPAVSVAVRELEARLGAPLFQREPPKGLSLTPYGRRKLVEARRLLAESDSFLRSEATGEPAGSVAFGYFATLGPRHVPALLRRAARELPAVTIDPVEADIEELVRGLESGRIELALAYDVGIAGRIEAEAVAQFPPYALLPAAHPLAKLEQVPLAALAAEPFILIDLPHSREFILSIFRASGHAPRIAWRSGSLEMVRGLVANGLGVSILVTQPIGDRAYDGKRIVQRPIGGTDLQQAMLVLTPEQVPLTRSAAAVADLIRRHFKAEPHGRR
jgi:DNA-binding transcriptional LysR family regulator